MIAAAYVRVSSKAQDCAMQRAAIERAALARGETIGAWYEEKRSGRSLDRAELARLRADARAGRVGRLYLFRLDRLTRSGIRDTFELVEELRAAGCSLVSVSDGFGLDGPAAEVILAVMAWAAKMERLAIGERIAAARLRVEAEGGTWGRPRAIVDLARAGALLGAGASVSAVARELGIPRATLQVALARQKTSAGGAG